MSTRRTVKATANGSVAVLAIIAVVGLAVIGIWALVAFFVLGLLWALITGGYDGYRAGKGDRAAQARIARYRSR